MHLVRASVLGFALHVAVTALATSAAGIKNVALACFNAAVMIVVGVVARHNERDPFELGESVSS